MTGVHDVDPRDAAAAEAQFDRMELAERRIAERDEGAEQVVEAIGPVRRQHEELVDATLGSDHGGVLQGERGVGVVLVRWVTVDARAVRLDPGPAGVADAVEVADHEVGFQSGGEGAVDATICGDHHRDHGTIGSPTEGRSNGSAAGDHDDRAGIAHEIPSAGITQIRFSGRWRRPPSQPRRTSELPVLRCARRYPPVSRPAGSVRQLRSPQRDA